MQEFFLSRNVKYVLGIIMCIILSSCASVVTPSGGKKDVTAPVLTAATPPPLATLFNEKTIVLSFNEFIQLINLDKQLVVSPLMKPAPEVTVKGKKVNIQLKATLQPNTTYTLNFGNAIADLHEGNPLRDFNYVFSTGMYVDTFQVTGKVEYAETRKAVREVMVMLYATNDDSLPYHSLPSFFSRTDSLGDFKIRNINKGPFKLFALKEANGDYRYNSGDEEIAFSNEEISGNDSVGVLRVFKEEEKKLFVKNQRFLNPAALQLVFNKPASILQINDLKHAVPPWRLMEFNTFRDTLILWMKDTMPDSLFLEIRNDAKIIDTISAGLPIVRNKNNKRTYSFLPSIQIASTVIFPGSAIQLSSVLPIDVLHHEKIKLMQDSTVDLAFKIIFSDSLKRVFNIETETKEKKNYTLTFLPGAITSIYGTMNDTMVLSFTTASYTDFGSLKIKLKGLTEGAYLLQLVGEKEEIIAEKKINNNGNYLFDRMNPVKCRIRLVVDTDGNGKFTTGNYEKKLQPELVFYNDEQVNVRANWDIEKDWTIFIKQYR